jgi:cytochrome c-type biogenesis protein
MEAPSIILAFVAGLLSFVSPCVLPLVPAYIGYLGGSTVVQARTALAGDGTMTVSTASARWTAVFHALIFVLGFTIIFVVVIGGVAGALSYALNENRRILQEIMGVLMVIFGLQMVGVINIPFLNYERRMADSMRPMPGGELGYLRSLAIGMAFAIGWTPCVGPILAGIFNLSLNGKPIEAFPLFIAYSLGLGIPFLLAALAMGQISTGLKRLTRRGYSLRIGKWTIIDQVNVVSLISGALLVAMGILIFTNSLTILAPSTTTWINF